MSLILSVCIITTLSFPLGGDSKRALKPEPAAAGAPRASSTARAAGVTDRAARAAGVVDHAAAAADQRQGHQEAEAR